MAVSEDTGVIIIVASIVGALIVFVAVLLAAIFAYRTYFSTETVESDVTEEYIYTADGRRVKVGHQKPSREEMMRAIVITEPDVRAHPYHRAPLKLECAMQTSIECPIYVRIHSQLASGEVSTPQTFALYTEALAFTEPGEYHLAAYAKLSPEQAEEQPGGATIDVSEKAGAGPMSEYTFIVVAEEEPMPTHALHPPPGEYCAPLTISVIPDIWASHVVSSTPTYPMPDEASRTLTLTTTGLHQVLLEPKDPNAFDVGFGGVGGGGEEFDSLAGDEAGHRSPREGRGGVGVRSGLRHLAGAMPTGRKVGFMYRVRPAMPAICPASGEVTRLTPITLSVPGQHAADSTVKYSCDGTAPATIYTGPIYAPPNSKFVTVRAQCVGQSGTVSDMAEATLKVIRAETVVFDSSIPPPECIVTAQAPQLVFTHVSAEVTMWYEIVSAAGATRQVKQLDRGQKIALVEEVRAVRYWAEELLPAPEPNQPPQRQPRRSQQREYMNARWVGGRGGPAQVWTRPRGHETASYMDPGIGADAGMAGGPSGSINTRLKAEQSDVGTKVRTWETDEHGQATMAPVAAGFSASHAAPTGGAGAGAVAPNGGGGKKKKRKSDHDVRVRLPAVGADDLPEIDPPSIAVVCAGASIRFDDPPDDSYILRYTIDGSEPSETTPQYARGSTVDVTQELLLHGQLHIRAHFFTTGRGAEGAAVVEVQGPQGLGRRSGVGPSTLGVAASDCTTKMGLPFARLFSL